jgi:histidinol phosphatase-like enzyme (inositol monophosphatase family)
VDARLAFCIETAFVAGRSTLALYQTGAAAQLKADQTPVTEADKRAEEIVRARIEVNYPGETVLGEEQGLEGSSDDRWVVDPIDGTKSFVAGVPLYATLLSFEQAGEPVVAACYIPALDEMYYAAKGQGAFCNGRVIRVSGTQTLEDALLLMGSYKSMKAHGRLEGWQKLAEQARMTRGWSDAFGHMMVASGRADVMLDPVLERWDISAPWLIVREAGGSCTDFGGNEGLAREAVSCTPALRGVVMEAFR